MAVSMGEAAIAVVFGRFRRVETSFRVAGVALRDIPTCFMTCRKSFCVARAILSRRFQKLTCIFRGRRNTLEMSSVTFRGRRSTLDVSCCVLCANRIVRAASRSAAVQIVWQAWYLLTCDIETPLSMGEAATVMLLWRVETPLSMGEAATVMMLLSVETPLSMGEAAKVMLCWTFQTCRNVAVYRGSCESDAVLDVSNVSKRRCLWGELQK
eukprot:s4006_g2.t1